MSAREQEIRDHRHISPLRPGDPPFPCKTCDALSLLDREREQKAELLEALREARHYIYDGPAHIRIVEMIDAALEAEEKAFTKHKDGEG